ncbi:ATP-binding protein [Acinetobacter bohemicus]|uniref:ATP-binding protein n=1 Tax=Acinetobacter sp. S4397-1 TaxID=2972915 RepID=UPI00209B5D3E|nr:ATP-binding protein [Acinetobacter sp. S4397-1]MCO8044961.1 ATP-binding protein [Acinetobacter sp. S4397-1]
MNAISPFSFGLKQVHEFCNKHQTAMVQAGPYHKCPQCAVEFLDEQKRNAQAEIDRAVREKHFAGAMLPERHAGSGFKNYDVKHAGQQNALNQVVSFAKNMINGHKNNFVMVGPTGTGKTHLSCATARTLLNKGKYARYITSEDMAQRIMNAWEQPDATEKSVIYDFTQYDLLILDEYGLHDRDKRRELVHKVLYARYDRMKPTMLISNLTLEELQKDLGDRLWSRFQQGSLTVVECNWIDQRVGGGV